MADTLDKLEAVARAASQPWNWHWDADPIKGDPLGRYRARVTTLGKTITQAHYSDESGQADAAHIAAFSPKTALALLAVARAASSMIREYDDLMLLLPGEHPAALRAALEELEKRP